VSEKDKGKPHEKRCLWDRGGGINGEELIREPRKTPMDRQKGGVTLQQEDLWGRGRAGELGPMK